MYVQANNKGGGARVHHKYADEHGYVADMGRNLYGPEVFSNLRFDTLNCYQQRHDSLNSDDFTVGCYAAMTPKGELIKIHEQVGKEMLKTETNPFPMDNTPLKREGRIYRRLVAAQQGTTQPLHRTTSTASALFKLEYQHGLRDAAVSRRFRPHVSESGRQDSKQKPSYTRVDDVTTTEFGKIPVQRHRLITVYIMHYAEFVA